MTKDDDVIESVIYRMTITRGGKKIRRPDGQPWKIVLRKSR